MLGTPAFAKRPAGRLRRAGGIRDIRAWRRTRDSGYTRHPCEGRGPGGRSLAWIPAFDRHPIGTGTFFGAAGPASAGMTGRWATGRRDSGLGIHASPRRRPGSRGQVAGLDSRLRPSSNRDKDVLRRGRPGFRRNDGAVGNRPSGLGAGDALFLFVAQTSVLREAVTTRTGGDRNAAACTPMR